MIASVTLVSSVVALISVLALLTLALMDWCGTGFRFWPPPDVRSWQNKVFRGLFRVLFYGLSVASAGHLSTYGMTLSGWQFGAAILLFLAGFGIAFVATGQLGWSNAFGSKDGLRTDGIFAYSRNPIYVATGLGLIGWGLVVPSTLIIVTLLFWGALYVVAVFLEERWLRIEYGAAFLSYARKTRRFF